MPAALARHLLPGDLMVSGQTLGEPEALLHELWSQVGDLHGLRLFAGMTLTSALGEVPDDVRLMSFVSMGATAKQIAAGRAELVPVHMSDLPDLLTSGPLRADVALVLVSPPDEEGWCSLGVQSDYLWPAVGAARVVLAEMNPNVPRVSGDTAIPVERFDAVVRSDRPLPVLRRPEPSASDLAIAAHLRPFIRDGTCLQVGVGKLGEAVLRSLGDRKHLGYHAGMVGDTVLELQRDGVITGVNKPVDQGMVVAGSLLGGPVTCKLADGNPALALRSVSYVNDPAVIAQLPDFLSINSAIEVDLLGQVNAEVAGGRPVGGTGGAVDFLRAARRAPGGRSIVALPATAGRSRAPRIVPRVAQVTALRTDVDVVVTEHGAAELSGASEGERARRLVTLAAPEHQQDLLRSMADLGL